MKQGIKYLIVGLVGAFSSLVLLFFGCKFYFNYSNDDLINLARLATTYHFITHKYVVPVDNHEITNAGIQSMLAELKDKHSKFLDEKAFNDLRTSTDGSFIGIGIIMGEKISNNSTVIVKVLKDSPASKAGLKPEDIIISVNGESVKGLPSEEISKKIRGPIDTEVKIGVLRDGKEQEFTLKREIVKYSTVEGSMIDENKKIGYIHINSFAVDTGEEFKTVLDDLKAQGLQGLIIDLRDNPGGVVQGVVDVGREILPVGKITSIINRNADRQTYEVKEQKLNIPMVVMINKYSASASELLTGALQDSGSAIVVGEKSYGKGSVQTIVPLSTTDGFKITIAKYYTPKMRSIDNIGIEPDITLRSTPYENPNVQIEQAKTILLKKMQEQNTQK